MPLSMARRLFLLGLICLAPIPAAAAPTCQDRNGSPARCGSADAMPPGWSLPPEEFAQRQKAAYPPPGRTTLLEVFAGLALFLAMIALLPRFDGSRDEDWFGPDRNDH